LDYSRRREEEGCGGARGTYARRVLRNKTKVWSRSVVREERSSVVRGVEEKVKRVLFTC
jgi:hypothetical protein